MVIESKTTFFERLKQGIDNFLSNLNLTSAEVIRYVSLFGIGFVLGLFLKRYLKYFILFFIFATLFLTVLSYLGLVVIKASQIKVMFGFSEYETFDMIINKIFNKLQIDVVEAGFGLLGCILGIKFG